MGFQAGDGEGWSFPGGPGALPATGVCGGQVVRTPPPILPEWLMHDAVSAGVITEMYANS